MILENEIYVAVSEKVYHSLVYSLAEALYTPSKGLVWFTVSNYMNRTLQRDIKGNMRISIERKLNKHEFKN